VAQVSNEQGRAALTTRIISFGTALAAVAIVLYALVYLQTRAWQVLGAAAGVTLALLCLMQARRLVPRAEFDAAGYWILGALLAAYGSGELVWSGLSPWHAVGAILLIVLVGNVVLRRKWGAWLLAAGMYGLFALLVNTFDPFPRFGVTQSPALAIFILGVTTSLALVLLSQLVLDFRPITIRSRLFVAFVLMVLLPAIAVAAVSSVVGFRSGRQQVIEQLESVATIKEAELDTWASNVQTDLATVATGDSVTRHMREILSLSVDPMGYQVAYNELHQHLGQMVERSPRLDGLFLMDLERRVVLSTDPAQEGASGAPGSLAYFRQGLKGEYLHRASYSLSVGGIAVIAVRPVLDDQGQALGILAGRAGPATLTEIMRERTGLGQTGETYLVTLGHIMLTEPRFRKERWDQTYYVFSEGGDAALEEHTNGYGSYSNYRGERVLGVYRWLPDLKLALLAEQAESEALVAVYTTVGINFGVTVVAVLVAAVVSLFLARSIALPLADLAETAVRVAGGELEHTADVRRDDEIGALARAFNTMTTRLRESINGLEQRVRERTQALERRALQLETSTRVSREITSILDIDDLLKRVVELMKRAFGYYYVAVFLVDDETNTLVLAAGSGELGQRRKREGMRLTIGAASLNGHVAQSNEAAMVNDVSQDPRYIADERLPDTCAELVIPLRIGERVLGTLDVQSAELNAFDEEDLRIMQSLGDQVAIAIENARLYDRSRMLAVLEERNRLAHELHDSVTQSLYSLVLFAGAGQEVVKSGGLEPVKQLFGRIEDTAQQALKEMRLLVFELRPPLLEDEGLVGALRQRLDAVEGRAGVKARSLVEGDVELPAAIEEGLYRIAQEALNNALKHAAAGSVTVSIRVTGERVELEVVDDGTGFDVEAVRDAGGLGLASMRDRAAELGGVFQITSAPKEGTSVKVGVETKSRTNSDDLPEVTDDGEDPCSSCRRPRCGEGGALCLDSR
jgi:nitrate/nitrite-specific signal transduction histidine kinase